MYSGPFWSPVGDKICFFTQKNSIKNTVDNSFILKVFVGVIDVKFTVSFVKSLYIDH